METEIRIQVPEGMEIDEENSTFECIKFKPKKLTYDDIRRKVMPYTHTVCTTMKHQPKCITFKKLLEVAEYLNNSWKPDWNKYKQIKYYIFYDYENKAFKVGRCHYINEGITFFSSEENAKKAIEIIGEEELKQFFS